MRIRIALAFIVILMLGITMGCKNTIHMAPLHDFNEINNIQQYTVE